NADLAGVDLSGSYLGLARLKGATLIRTNLSGADLVQASLPFATLIEANLTRTNLSWTDLGWANLTKSILVGASLQEASLRGANFSGADLTGAALYGAFLDGTVFSDTCLKGAVGLDTCEHEGPSTTDLGTLRRSWPVPSRFLHGCGLADGIIRMLPALLNEPRRFFSCFISYASSCQEFAARLHSDLVENGVPCWFAAHDMQGGKKIHEQIEGAILNYDRMLLILSQHSMSSEWVSTEIANARQREVGEGRRVLFPIRLVDFETLRSWRAFDADVGKDSAREVREYFIPDFSNWRDTKSYRRAFDQLLSDLR